MENYWEGTTKEFKRIIIILLKQFKDTDQLQNTKNKETNEMRAVYPRYENKGRNAEEHLTWDDIENEKLIS